MNTDLKRKKGSWLEVDVCPPYHTPLPFPLPHSKAADLTSFTMESLRGHNLCQDFPTVSLGIWCILAHSMKASVTLRAEGWLAVVQPCLPSRASRKFRILPSGWPKWGFLFFWGILSSNPPIKTRKTKGPFFLYFFFFPRGGIFFVQKKSLSFFFFLFLFLPCGKLFPWERWGKGKMRERMKRRGFRRNSPFPVSILLNHFLSTCALVEFWTRLLYVVRVP